AKVVLALEPNNKDIRTTLANIAANRNDWETSANEHDKADNYPNRHLMSFYLKLGYLDKVIKMGAELIEKDPSDPYPFLLAGLAELSTGRTKVGIKNIEQAIILGFFGGGDWIIAEHQAFNEGDHTLLLIKIARDFEKNDPTLFPLLGVMKELLASTEESREQAIKKFWLVAKAHSFEREELLSKVNLPDSVRLLLGDLEGYANMFFQNYPTWHLWTPMHQNFRRSDTFKRLIRETNIFNYWQKHGFPDLCRPIGKDDFECD
ncbi:MAG: hypothetical protein OEY19_08920, partial [Gammaproteobacteria bacterium]|nr:hypothetical protein [Gammaproteobacteria bacterium]